jgi:hypothetical protein
VHIELDTQWHAGRSVHRVFTGSVLLRLHRIGGVTMRTGRQLETSGPNNGAEVFQRGRPQPTFCERRSEQVGCTRDQGFLAARWVTYAGLQTGLYPTCVCCNQTFWSDACFVQTGRHFRISNRLENKSPCAKILGVCANRKVHYPKGPVGAGVIGWHRGLYHTSCHHMLCMIVDPYSLYVPLRASNIMPGYFAILNNYRIV